MRIEYLIPILSYLLGSIPFGYLLIKYKEGQDIRSFGSGNIGATNAFRKSHTIGILTFVLDAGKGYLAVVLAGWLGGNPEWQAAAAVFAIIGHVFTIWLRFKGGKGVSTWCGAYLALSPIALLTTMVFFRADYGPFTLCLSSVDCRCRSISVMGIHLWSACIRNHRGRSRWRFDCCETSSEYSKNPRRQGE